MELKNLMTKLKRWLLERFLPEYCRCKLIEENERLKEEAAELRQKNRELKSFINGMSCGMRSQKEFLSITIREE